MIRKLLSLLILLLTSCGSGGSTVAPSSVTVWLFRGNLAITDLQANAVFSEVRDMYLSAGIDLELSLIVHVDACSENSTLANYKEAYDCAYNNIIPSSDINYGILPPIIDSGVSYQGGRSFNNYIAVGNAIANRIPGGEDRLHKAAIVMAHEIGHLLGAKANPSTSSIMNENAAAYDNVYFDDSDFN